jgi:hypothetical protein
MKVSDLRPTSVLNMGSVVVAVYGSILSPQFAPAWEIVEPNATSSASSHAGQWIDREWASYAQALSASPERQGHAKDGVEEWFVSDGIMPTMTPTIEEFEIEFDPESTAFKFTHEDFDVWE